MKKIIKKPSKKIYHGTSEIIAKTATVAGLKPYEIPPFDNGKPRSICASSLSNISLTDVYSGFMAFDTCTTKERWGLIEIDVDELDNKLFVPHELFLLEKSKKKFSSYQEQYEYILDYRGKLIANHKYWKDSLQSMGLCAYHGTIPVEAISKITIFDWRSNWLITREVINATFTSKFHKLQSDRHKLVNRWFMCEAVDPREWVSDYEKMTISQREQISSGVVNKSGLDMYYQRSVGKR